jgi:hypothetical protein
MGCAALYRAGRTPPRFCKGKDVGCAVRTLHPHSSMIVMGSHGHGVLRNLAMRSVATKVIATTADIPVLIVR